MSRRRYRTPERRTTARLPRAARDGRPASEPRTSPSGRLATRARTIERSRRELVVIKSSSPVQQLQSSRKLNRYAPFVQSAARSRESLGCFVPPWRDTTGHRLDDEQSHATSGRLDESRLDAPADVSRQFVENVCGDHRIPGVERRQARHVALSCTSAHAELRVGPVRFGYGPRMAVDPADQRAAACQRPPGGGGTGSTAEIDDDPRRLRGGGQCAHDRMHREQMQWRIEKGEGCALTCAVERRPNRRAAPLDIRRRQRSKRSCDFGKSKIGEMSRLQCREPSLQELGIRECHRSAILNRKPAICKWNASS